MLTQHEENSKFVSKTHIRQTRAGQLQQCTQHPRPVVNGNISVADCMPLVYSKLLKLTTLSNADDDKIAIDHCWSSP